LGGKRIAGPPPLGKMPDMLPLSALLLLAAIQAPGAEAPQSRPSPFEGGLEAVEPRGLRLRTPGATPGYLLVNPLNSKNAHLVDLDGNTVHTWKTQYVPGGACVLLPNGNLLRQCQEPDNPRFHGGGIAGRIQELAWDSSVVWEHVQATDQLTLHHDFDVLPNGNLLLIAWEYHSPDEALAAGRDLHAVVEEGLWPDTILELERNPRGGGKVVWQWRAWDHLMQDRNPKKPNFVAKADHPGRLDINADHRFEPREESDAERKKREEEEKKMAALGYAGGGAPPPAKGPDKPKSKYKGDWMHTNSVKHHAGLDVIVISSPELGELLVIDHSTTTAQAATSSGGRHGKGGDILFRWGNPRNYGRGTEADQRLHYQHNPTWLKNADAGAPRLLVFDNGMHRPGDFSQVLELELPYASGKGFELAAGAAFGPREPVWAYKDAPLFFSPFISGAQRLANGNTLICSGAAGRVFEVTPEKEVVWDWRNTLGGEEKPTEQGGKAPPHALFRAERYGVEYSGLAKLKR